MSIADHLPDGLSNHFLVLLDDGEAYTAAEVSAEMATTLAACAVRPTPFGMGLLRWQRAAGPDE